MLLGGKGVDRIAELIWVGVIHKLPVSQLPTLPSQLPISSSTDNRAIHLLVPPELGLDEPQIRSVDI
jgi:hypothetical protein